MIAELKPYSAMKDSGVPWLGAVPEHWSLVPNRALMRRRKVLVGARHSEYQLLSLTKRGAIVRDVESGNGKFSADMVTGKLDVRAAAAKFPDEADEPEALDDGEALAESDEDTADGDLDAATEEAET